jgi:hypothetical protein
MIQLTDVYCLSIRGPAIFDYNKRLILISVIQLSGEHCTIFDDKIELVILRRIGIFSDGRNQEAILQTKFSLLKFKLVLSFLTGRYIFWD